MRKDRKLVIGNWKMNPQTLVEAKKTFSSIKKKASSFKHVEILLCVPTLFVSELKKSDPQNLVDIGVQNIFWESAGAFTGEIGPVMMREMGVTHTLVGHSERRERGESDEDVHKKVTAALAEGLKVVVCIGEKSRDSDGDYLAFVKSQLAKALEGVNKKQLGLVTIAYEPVWAIGKSDAEAMKGKDMHEMSLFIRKALSEMYTPVDVAPMKILYGGSVSSHNTLDIVGEGHVDGLLVGRQSLFAQGFLDIIGIVDSL